jgi:hypothetical protein
MHPLELATLNWDDHLANPAVVAASENLRWLTDQVVELDSRSHLAPLCPRRLVLRPASRTKRPRERKKPLVNQSLVHELLHGILIEERYHKVTGRFLTRLKKESTAGEVSALYRAYEPHFSDWCFALNENSLITQSHDQVLGTTKGQDLRDCAIVCVDLLGILRAICRLLRGVKSAKDVREKVREFASPLRVLEILAKLDILDDEAAVVGCGLTGVVICWQIAAALNIAEPLLGEVESKLAGVRDTPVVAGKHSASSAHALAFDIAARVTRIVLNTSGISRLVPFKNPWPDFDVGAFGSAWEWAVQRLERHALLLRPENCGLLIAEIEIESARLVKSPAADLAGISGRLPEYSEAFDVVMKLRPKTKWRIVYEECVRHKLAVPDELSTFIRVMQMKLKALRDDGTAK